MGGMMSGPMRVAMMGGMGLVLLLIVAALTIGVVALVKYLRSRADDAAA